MLTIGGILVLGTAASGMVATSALFTKVAASAVGLKRSIEELKTSIEVYKASKEVEDDEEDDEDDEEGDTETLNDLAMARQNSSQAADPVQ